MQKIIDNIESAIQNGIRKAATVSLEYHDYTIIYDPKQTQNHYCDWYFAHKDFDGAEDKKDYRCGYASSAVAAMDRIDILEDFIH